MSAWTNIQGSAFILVFKSGGHLMLQIKKLQSIFMKSNSPLIGSMSCLVWAGPARRDLILHINRSRCPNSGDFRSLLQLTAESKGQRQLCLKCIERRLPSQGVAPHRGDRNLRNEGGPIFTGVVVEAGTVSLGGHDHFGTRFGVGPGKHL
jgi:hypothetical protein